MCVGHRPPGNKGADRVCGAINPAKIVAGYDPRSVDVQELVRLHVSIVYGFRKRVAMYSSMTKKWRFHDIGKTFLQNQKDRSVRREYGWLNRKRGTNVNSVWWSAYAQSRIDHSLLR